MKNKDKLFDDKFLLGVNYWPRHKAVRMWKDWAPKEIASEFAEMKALSLNCARVFTVWDDFQPLLEAKGYMAQRGETVLRHDSNVISTINLAMIDPVMIERFDQLLEIARDNGIGLIVTLLVGWMSGGLLDISWREGRNIFTDPAMLKWQSLYCRFFASRYCDEKIIIAWDLGNEQNCFMECPNQEAAWNWTNTLVSVLKRYDPHHPVVSGMHSLGLSRHDGDNAWTIRDVADCCDLTVVHPYPSFIDGGNLDEPENIRTTLLAAAQNSLYAGVGGKPCLCQEFGSLGDSIMSEPAAANYLRATLYSLLSGGSLGALWWCHTDFTCGDIVPYRWSVMESDGLGLHAVDGRVKPAGQEFKKFADILSKLRNCPLNPTVKRAAIMLPFRANDWKSLFNSYILCKQAGIEAEFIDSFVAPQDYDLVLLPSLSGFNSLESRQWQRLKEYVYNGGTLYLSHHGISLPGLEEVFGIHPIMKKRPMGERKLIVVQAMGIGAEKKFCYEGCGDFQLICEPVRSQVILGYPDENPAMTIADYGKGQAILMNEPIEMLLSRTPDVYATDESWLIYRWLKQQAGIKEWLEVEHPLVQCTVHPDKEGARAIIINHSALPIDVMITCHRPVASCRTLLEEEVTMAERGDNLRLNLNACQGEVMEITFRSDC